MSTRPVDLDGLPTPRRWWAMAAIGLAVTMAVLDGAIANVALPTIARELHASSAASIWIVNAYQIAMLVGLLPLASLGEVVGYRRVSQVGLVVFTLGSLACALSPSLPLLSVSRVLQGLGAAGILSVNGALARFTYPQRMLGRGIAINAVVVSVASAAGPTLASAILSVASWRWLFGVNLPIGALTLVIARYAQPSNPLTRRPLNIAGALLNVAVFALMFTGLQALTQATGRGLGVLEIAGGLLAGAVLIRRELDSPTPMIPIDLLRIRLFALSLATSVAAFVATTLALVALPFDFQERLGRSAVTTGLLMTPWPLAAAVAAPFAGRLADRYPPGLLGGAGLVVFTAGLALLATLPTPCSDVDVVWRMAVCGLGFGFFQSPNNRAIIGSAPRSRAGAASGMLSTARLVGQASGAVIVAAMFRASTRGPSLALFLATAVALIAAGVSLLRRGDRVQDAPPTEKAFELGGTR